METKLRNLAKKPKYITRLFLDAITYRVPLSVTKVIVYRDGTTYPICPRCLMSLDREYMSFCDRCGQKLNWDLLDHAKICRPNDRRK